MVSKFRFFNARPMHRIVIVILFVCCLQASLHLCQATSFSSAKVREMNYRISGPALAPVSALAGYSVHLEFNSIVLPLKRAGNLIMLEAIIDSVQGNLILDTGSSSLVLNSVYFRHGRRTNLMAGGITGSAGSVGDIMIDNIQISDLSFSNIKATTTDLSHIEKARNVKVLGFFGLGMFKEFEVVVDVKNALLELHRLNYWGKRMDNSNALHQYDIFMPIQVESDVVFVEAVIKRRKLLFCLDTGAESNVLSSSLPSRVLNTVDVYRRANLRGAGTEQVEVLYGFMNDFRIAGGPVMGMNTLVTNLNSMSKYFNLHIHGMLGCEFLEKGVFYINIMKAELGIVFNKEEKNEK